MANGIWRGCCIPPTPGNTGKHCRGTGRSGSRLRHPGYPNWPPEFVLGIHQTAGKLVVTHRDEWVPFEPGSESLWEASFDGSSWRVSFLRLIDYETEDHPTPVPEIDLSSLPLPIQRPIHPPKPH